MQQMMTIKKRRLINNNKLINNNQNKIIDSELTSKKNYLTYSDHNIQFDFVVNVGKMQASYGRACSIRKIFNKNGMGEDTPSLRKMIVLNEDYLKSSQRQDDGYDKLQKSAKNQKQTQLQSNYEQKQQQYNKLDDSDDREDIILCPIRNPYLNLKNQDNLRSFNITTQPYCQLSPLTYRINKSNNNYLKYLNQIYIKGQQLQLNRKYSELIRTKSFNLMLVNVFGEVLEGLIEIEKINEMYEPMVREMDSQVKSMERVYGGEVVKLDKHDWHGENDVKQEDVEIQMMEKRQIQNIKMLQEQLGELINIKQALIRQLSSKQNDSQNIRLAEQKLSVQSLKLRTIEQYLEDSTNQLLNERAQFDKQLQLFIEQIFEVIYVQLQIWANCNKVYFVSKDTSKLIESLQHFISSAGGNSYTDQAIKLFFMTRLYFSTKLYAEMSQYNNVKLIETFNKLNENSYHSKKIKSKSVGFDVEGFYKYSETVIRLLLSDEGMKKKGGRQQMCQIVRVNLGYDQNSQIEMLVERIVGKCFYDIE